MALNKLIIPPDRSGYAFTDGNQILSVKLDGGGSKFRRDIADANSIFNVQWTLDRDLYSYIRTFFKVSIRDGVDPFLIDLYYDNAYELTEHKVHFLPGTFGLKSQSGDQFVVAAQIEVEPIALDQNLVNSLLVFGLFGYEFLNYIGIFDRIINIDLPGIMS